MAKTREQLTDEMIDREAIRDLPHRYAHYIWTGNAEGIANLFTQDGWFGSIPEVTPRTQGRDNLLKFYAAISSAPLQPRPYVHQHVIELKGNNRASGTVYIELRDANQDMKWIGTAYYDDEYEKVNGEWKFRSRLAHLIGVPRQQ